MADHSHTHKHTHTVVVGDEQRWKVTKYFHFVTVLK